MKSILLAIRSKGLSKYLRRGGAIVRSYGLTTSKMVRSMDQLSRILVRFDCAATLPITAAVLERNRKAVDKYLGLGIEFAIHGYRHIDHSQLGLDELATQLLCAERVFASTGLPVAGFRSPYLRFNQHLRVAVGKVGLGYLSNQPIIWDVVQGERVSREAQTAYGRAIAFYQPWSADEVPVLPHLDGDLVEIPVSLPDDEMILDRLGGDAGVAERAWSRILAQTYEREELFTLQLHPERISRCASSLSSVLAQARNSNPPVWVARLDEIATWWRSLLNTKIYVNRTDEGELNLTWRGPDRMAVLVRNLEVQGPVSPWRNGYRRCQAQPLIFRTDFRPFIGVPERTSGEWIGLLRQLGYIVETSDDCHNYSIYLDQLGPVGENDRAGVAEIEKSERPLIKLARWPDNACSALAITGDLDALTLWDYGLRFLGH